MERKDLAEIPLREQTAVALDSTLSHFPTYLPVRKEGFILLVEVSKTEEGTDEIEEKSLRMRMHSSEE